MIRGEIMQINEAQSYLIFCIFNRLSLCRQVLTLLKRAKLQNVHI